MYKTGDKFTTDYDDATWTIISETVVIDDDDFDFKPGYIVKSSNIEKSFSVSHDIIEKGVYIKKLLVKLKGAV